MLILLLTMMMADDLEKLFRLLFLHHFDFS
jgi:hypothetical protein